MWHQTPTNFYQYIRSPNYPQPFPEGQSCSWKISAPLPFQIEIVNYDGSETCDNHKLRILSIFEPDARRKPELSRVYDQENTICRSTKPQFIYADEVFDQPYSAYTAHVLFYNENNKNNSKGFSLRYKFHESSEIEMPKAALSMGNVESASSNESDVDSWCPPDVVLERGQEFVLSSDNFTSSRASGRIAKCVMTVRSKYFDSTILMYLKRGYSAYGTHQLRYLEYSPLDITGESFEERNFQTIIAQREYEFEHQVVKIDMMILSIRHGYGNQYEFDLVFKVQEEPLCGSESRKVSFNDGYVGSPNYPEPYSQSVTCKWTFSGRRPFQFELLDYDGGETCADQYLLINYGPSDERQILICGKTENGILNDEGIFDYSYDNTFTATIVFHKAQTDGDHKGFLLRYKLIDGDFDWDHRGRPRTIKLVGLIVLGVAGFLLLVSLGIKIALRWKRQRMVKQEKQEALQKSLIGKWLEHSLGERETNKFSEFLVGKIKLKSTPPSVSDPTDTAQDKPLISSSGFGMSEEDVERRESGLNAALLSLNFSAEERQHDTVGRANDM